MYLGSVADDRYFLVAAQNVIARVSLDGRRYQVLVRNLQNAVAVDYDYRYVYYLKWLSLLCLLNLV